MASCSRKGLPLYFCLTAALSAQSSYFERSAQQRMNDIQQQRNTLTLSEDSVQGEQRVKPQVDPCENVGIVPDLLPAGVIWQVTGLKPFGIQPILSEDAVSLITADQHLHCLDLATGKERWSFNLKATPISQIVLLGGRLLVGTDSGEFLCLDPANGKLNWKVSLKSAKGGKLGKDEIQPVTQPILREGRIFLGTFTSGLFKTTGRLYAFDLAKGDRLWDHEISNGVTQPPVVTGDLIWAGGGEYFGAFRISDGQEVKAGKIKSGSMSLAIPGSHGVIFGSGGEVYCIDSSKSELGVLSSIRLGTGLAVEGDRLVANNGALAVHELPSGKECWRGEDKTIGVPVLRNGRIFISASPRTIKVFDVNNGRQVGSLELSADLGFPRPLVNGEKALACERTKGNGVILEAFKAPAWKAIWRLEIQEPIASLPLFTPKGMVLWTASGYLRLLR